MASHPRAIHSRPVAALRFPSRAPTSHPPARALAHTVLPVPVPAQSRWLAILPGARAPRDEVRTAAVSPANILPQRESLSVHPPLRSSSPTADPIAAKYRGDVSLRVSLHSRATVPAVTRSAGAHPPDLPAMPAGKARSPPSG